MVIHGGCMDNHSNFVIRGYSDKGVSWTMVDTWITIVTLSSADTLTRGYGDPW